MTFTVSTENFYLCIIVILLVLQVYQYSLIQKLTKQIDSIWEQIGMLAMQTSIKLAEITGKQKQTEDEKK